MCEDCIESSRFILKKARVGPSIGAFTDVARVRARSRTLQWARRSAHAKRQPQSEKLYRAASVASKAICGADIWSTGSVDGSSACIVFVMKPPRPPVQAVVDSRLVIFCERLSEDLKTKVSTQSNLKEIHSSRLKRSGQSQELPG